MSDMKCNGSEDADVKHGQHLQLAAIVKGVHAKLRRSYIVSGNISTTWTEHCQDQETLSSYATAMHSLAVDHWTQRPQTRIHWCRNTAQDYFYRGGLETALSKDERTKSHEMRINNGAKNIPAHLNCCPAETSHLQSDAPETSDAPDTSDAPGTRHVPETHDALGTLRLSQPTSEATKCEHGNFRSNKRNLPFGDRLRLLDVGSCYNPFAEFDDFITVGIDISPAVESVFQCDLLQLDISPTAALDSANMDEMLKSLKGPAITQLPSDSFHVIIFSLLLEYLPCARQRWQCCIKSHQLLRPNGLLIIITPDSAHQNKNVSQMKSWKCALESMGFKRWKYEKQEHLHCMAFRKFSNHDTHYYNYQLVADTDCPDMLFIPQDLTAGKLSSMVSSIDSKLASDDHITRTNEEVHLIQESFSELPNFIHYSEDFND